MVYMVFFPMEGSAAVRTYPNIPLAEAAGRTVPFGPVYIFANVSEKALSLMTAEQLKAIYNTANFTKKRIKWPSLESLIRDALPLIEVLAAPGEVVSPPPSEEAEMARKKKQKEGEEPAAAEDTLPKKGKAKKGGPKTKKAASEKSATAKAGRKPKADYSGMYLYKTEEGERIKRHEGSRRTQTYNTVKDGMTFEKAIELGADPGDLIRLIQWNNIEALPEKRK